MAKGRREPSTPAEQIYRNVLGELKEVAGLTPHQLARRLTSVLPAGDRVARSTVDGWKNQLKVSPSPAVREALAELVADELPERAADFAEAIGMIADTRALDADAARRDKGRRLQAEVAEYAPRRGAIDPRLDQLLRAIQHAGHVPTMAGRYAAMADPDPAPGADRWLQTSGATGGALPAYVDRTVDDEVDRRLAETRIVVIVGPPKSGKTRSAIEAVQRNAEMRNAPLHEPHRPVDATSTLSAYAEALNACLLAGRLGEDRPVVFVDDLQDHLRAPDRHTSRPNAIRFDLERPLRAGGWVIATCHPWVTDAPSEFAGLSEDDQAWLRARAVRLEAALDGRERATAVERLGDAASELLAENLAGVDALERAAWRELAADGPAPRTARGEVLRALIDLTAARLAGPSDLDDVLRHAQKLSRVPYSLAQLDEGLRGLQVPVLPESRRSMVWSVPYPDERISRERARPDRREWLIEIMERGRVQLDAALAPRLIPGHVRSPDFWSTDRGAWEWASCAAALARYAADGVPGVADGVDLALHRAAELGDVDAVVRAVRRAVDVGDVSAAQDLLERFRRAADAHAFARLAVECRDDPRLAVGDTDAAFWADLAEQTALDDLDPVFTAEWLGDYDLDAARRILHRVVDAPDLDPEERRGDALLHLGFLELGTPNGYQPVDSSPDAIRKALSWYRRAHDEGLTTAWSWAVDAARALGDVEGDDGVMSWYRRGLERVSQPYLAVSIAQDAAQVRAAAGDVLGPEGVVEWIWRVIERFGFDEPDTIAYYLADLDPSCRGALRHPGGVLDRLERLEIAGDMRAVRLRRAITEVLQRNGW